ncbi:programmed cell death 1 ligand 1-like [Mastacembelus armatus]|uniref:programmed cell death 1 ligand 1-like n=1 Tax=Mastacembelus armatus TaxID=205130 RepID=UPI0014369BB1|nr:programmed cell death 1 ligand 1-like [Mastacembelus armatus]
MVEQKPAALLSLCFLVCVTEGLTNITAERGQNITLPCRDPSSSEITHLQWTRPDLYPDYVFVYRDGRFDPVNQHPSFKERVELKDSQMKDGDVSVTLKDVMFNDSGTYKCRVFQGQTEALELINIVHLTVVSAGHREDGGDQGGRVGLIVAAAVLLVAVVGLVLVFCIRHQTACFVTEDIG